MKFRALTREDRKACQDVFEVARAEPVRLGDCLVRLPDHIEVMLVLLWRLTIIRRKRLDRWNPATFGNGGNRNSRQKRPTQVRTGSSKSGKKIERKAVEHCYRYPQVETVSFKSRQCVAGTRPIR